MITLNILNLLVLFVIFLVLTIFIITFYFILKKKSKRLISIALIVEVTLVILLFLFYSPVKITVPKSSLVTIESNGYRLEVDDPEQSEDIKQYIREQSFQRSIFKTLNGVPPAPVEENIHIRIDGPESTMLIYLRKDKVKYSYLECNGQYYSIKEVEKMINKMEEVLAIY